jgi:4-amino-4-deoxy-L-arabinose transferase-like glycosyltransferase
VQFAWRLGYPSFWDPDEATYAETTREMLAAHSWLVPSTTADRFSISRLFSICCRSRAFGFWRDEFAARFVPAVSAAAILLIVAWFGRHLFDRDVGRNGALMFAVLPATFALSSYAILDMTFTALLFGSWALLTVSALKEQPRLQWPGTCCLLSRC